ncbi:hypothetical protein [Streptomyces sp. NPDC097610]|uniref:hypothetical protein n=1 Tax=Streptomyces sp. NPDC097610 TaxID=3157227 RepID=UPI00331EBC9B
MNTPKRTENRIPRAVQAVMGAAGARRHVEFVEVVARQLDQIAPGTVRVRVVPVTRDGRRLTWVVLDSSNGPVGADREAHRAAYGLLTRAFPSADWNVAQTYDARTGALTTGEPTAPAELGLAATPDARP